MTSEETLIRQPEEETTPVMCLADLLSTEEREQTIIKLIPLKRIVEFCQQELHISLPPRLGALMNLTDGDEQWGLVDVPEEQGIVPGALLFITKPIESLCRVDGTQKTITVCLSGKNNQGRLVLEPIEIRFASHIVDEQNRKRVLAASFRLPSGFLTGAQVSLTQEEVAILGDYQFEEAGTFPTDIRLPFHTEGHVTSAMMVLQPPPSPFPLRITTALPSKVPYAIYEPGLIKQGWGLNLGDFRYLELTHQEQTVLTLPRKLIEV